MCPDGHGQDGGVRPAYSAPLAVEPARGALRGRRLRVLVLSPTRELAAQIAQSFAAYGRHSGLRHTVVYGGVGQSPQVRALRQGVDILVATPGRLLDLMQQGFVHLDEIEMFVLDEADRMLDMGFLPDLRRVIARLPERRQNILFSATMPEAIERLAQTILRQPVSVRIAPVKATTELDRAIGLLRAPPAKARVAAELFEAAAGAAGLGLYAHQARGRQGIAAVAAARHSGGSHPRQQEPVGPAAGPGRLQGRSDAGPGSHRPGGARASTCRASRTC